jgi:hypothetical protein
MKQILWSFVLVSIALPMCVSPLLAHEGSTARVEDNDPSVVYTGNWYPNSAAPNSGGHATMTNLLNARVSITFTGTGISWIGVSDPWSGFARLYLDGVLNTVDTYSSDTIYQKVLFSAHGLPAGAHTLSIEAMHTRDVNGSGSWIWIDGFDVENGHGVSGGVSAPTGRTEQNGAAVNYTGSWFLNTNPVQSGGTAVLSVDTGSRATVTFNGTGIKWLVYRDAWSGIAKIYVDGAFKTTIDTYFATDQARADGYTITGLLPGTHTLTIEVTGTHSANSRGSWIWVDAFDVFGGQ